ncbi:hypothetical protein KC640_01850, partial [Candidatus Dojkabacteria bacterium]|nr:hypothetical protein [Candidatus Dojkabacteria bacterium]
TVARLMVKEGALAKKYLPEKQKFEKTPGKKATERNEKKSAAAEAAKAEKPAEVEASAEAAPESPEATAETKTGE